MAGPIRFRCSRDRWTETRVRSELLAPLEDAIGASLSEPRFSPPGGYGAHRFDMANGDIALFLRATGDGNPGGGGGAFWLGNTETPAALWRTDKYTFDEVPYPVARWAQRELLAELAATDPWLADYEYVAWFFLPVFFSKDGRHSTRAFFRDHAAGFPDASREEALAFFERFLRTGVLDAHRYTMAAKLGTSESLNVARMSATMGEFTAAKLLTDAGYEVTPEIEVTTGHSLDFRARRNGDSSLVEVTRPRPPTDRAAGTPAAAVRDTAGTKVDGQLSRHGGGAVLFVDCSSFSDGEWVRLRDEQPEVRHRPAVVFRARPDGSVEGYRKGSVPLSLDGVLSWV